MKKTAFAATLLLTLVGCATTPYRPPTGKPIAYLTVNRADLGARLGSFQDAMIYHRGPYTGPTISGDAPLEAMADYVYDTPIPIEAEARVIIMIDLRTSLLNWQSYCARNYAFTPKTGHTYRFTPRGAGNDNNCETTIIDTQTGVAPEELLRVERDR